MLMAGNVHVGNPTTKVDKFEQITTDNADGWQRTRW